MQSTLEPLSIHTSCGDDVGPRLLPQESPFLQREASTLCALQLQVTAGGTEVEGEVGGGGDNAAATSMTVSNKSSLTINAQLYTAIALGPHNHHVRGIRCPSHRCRQWLALRQEPCHCPAGRPGTERALLWLMGLCSLPGLTARLGSPGDWEHGSVCPSQSPSCPHLPAPRLLGHAASLSFSSSWPHRPSGQGSSPLSKRVRMSGLEMA